MLIKNLKKLGILGILLVTVVVTSSVLLSYTFSVDDLRFKDQVRNLKAFSFLFLGVNLLYLVAQLFLMKGLSKLVKMIFNLLIAMINIFYGVYMIYSSNKIETFEGFTDNVNDLVQIENSNLQLSDREEYLELIGKKELDENEKKRYEELRQLFEIENNLSGDSSYQGQENVNYPKIIYQPVNKPTLPNPTQTLSPTEKKTKYAGYATGSLGLTIGVGIASSTLFNLNLL